MRVNEPAAACSGRPDPALGQSLFSFDLAAAGVPRIAGVDEVGRGPLAGPVYAAAVVLPEDFELEGLRDSKRLSAMQREVLDERIRASAVAFGIGRASVAEIDRFNILRATHLAMRRAVQRLEPEPDVVFVDGNQAPNLRVPVVTLVGGDDRHAAISAASVLAKVARDAEMLRLAARHPGYGFDRHKGYATRLHLDALGRLGPSPVHRRSFAPVARLIRNENPEQGSLPLAGIGEPGGALGGES